MMNACDRRGVEPAEILYLKSMCGITIYDRVRDKRNQELTGVTTRLRERVDESGGT